MRSAAVVTAAAAATVVGCNPYPLDDTLRFSDVQARGTHNSYHVEPEDPIDPSHRYTQPSLRDQLENDGVRQFELDLHLTTGGSFQVFHLPGVDADSTCGKLTSCLDILKTWSDEHPLHMPLLVWLEPKDEELDYADERFQPIAGHYDALEAQILDAWPKDRILTPDEVRGDEDTLPAAVKKHGFPTLGALRGRIAFAMLDSDNHRAAYIEGATNLKDKLLFVDADDDGDDFAAMFKIDDAEADGARIEKLVKDGFMVTSNADAADADDGDNADRLAATLAAGAQFFASDFPHEREGYWAKLNRGAPAVCNPVAAPAACAPRDIEALPDE